MIFRTMPTPPPSAPAIAGQEVTVLNKLGLHARPAAEFVRCARQFESAVEIITPAGSFSAKRVIDVLLAGLSSGMKFQLVAEGIDAPRAVETLVALLQHFAERDRMEEVPREARGFRRFDLDDW